MGWGRLHDLIENAKALDINEGFAFAFGFDENQDLIISFNTGEGTQYGQLWQGIDSEGRELSSIGGEYSDFTKRIKSAKGDPTDRVTLYDTGETYESWRVNVGADGLTIKANLIKEGENLEDRWGDALLGLTPENQTRLVNAINEYLSEWLLNQILK